VNGVERAQAVLAETPGAFTAIARSREQRLLACEAAALDGTRLANCVKLKVPLERPASEAPYGFVLEPVFKQDGSRAERPAS